MLSLKRSVTLKHEQSERVLSPIKVLFAAVACNASINKSSAARFGPVRVRIHSLCYPVLVLFRWLTKPSRPDQGYTSCSSAPTSSSASADELQLTCVSPLYAPGLLPTLPQRSIKVLHNNVLLLVHYPVAALFVLCLANCAFSGLLPGPRIFARLFPQLSFYILFLGVVISSVFLPALPWQPETVSNALTGLLTLRLPS